MKKIVIGNWKMNPESSALATKIIQGIKKLSSKSKVDIVICPSTPFLHLIPSQIKLGAQDVSTEKGSGAFTGEVSAAQLKSAGVTYAIVGHSERRAMGETSAVVAKKALALLSTKISPIICIGEKERHDGEHWQVISHELRASLSTIPKSLAHNCIIAYEPIWAVGKKSKGAMKADEISESAIFIKKIISEIFGSNTAQKIRVIYGGSVDTKNAATIASATGVSGFLVGRDSLVPSHFAKIAEALQ